MTGIYKIENLLNHKVYIGQSVNIAQRWKEHRYCVPSWKNSEYPLYRAIHKYGIDNFEFSVLQECSKEQLNELEIYWIEKYNSFNQGYNQTKGGDGNPHPLKLSEEQVLEIYEKLKGTQSMEEIANEYGVTHPTISNINTGVLWVHKNISYPIRKKEIAENYCCDCGIKISKNAIRCNKCNGILRKTDKPITREQLKSLIRVKSFVQIGKDFNVSDNTIRKWCDFYNLPRKKSEIVNFLDEEWKSV